MQSHTHIINYMDYLHHKYCHFISLGKDTENEAFTFNNFIFKGMVCLKYFYSFNIKVRVSSGLWVCPENIFSFKNIF